MFEIRNYHFDPELFDQYKAWATTSALPYIRSQVDLVGFWTSLDEPAQVGGEPLDDLGSANVTWIIRWPDQPTREAEFKRVFTSPEWAEIFKDVPGGARSYRRAEAKFAEQLA